MGAAFRLWNTVHPCGDKALAEFDIFVVCHGHAMNLIAVLLPYLRLFLFPYPEPALRCDTTQVFVLGTFVYPTVQTSTSQPVWLAIEVQPRLVCIHSSQHSFWCLKFDRFNGTEYIRILWNDYKRIETCDVRLMWRSLDLEVGWMRTLQLGRLRQIFRIRFVQGASPGTGNRQTVSTNRQLAQTPETNKEHIKTHKNTSIHI